MTTHRLIVDRGHAVELESRETATQSGVHWIAVARQSSVKLVAGASSIWMQLRGTSDIVAREGRFRLARGEWLALERDSLPELQCDRGGLTLGLAVGPGAIRSVRGPILLPGRGAMRGDELRMAIRLWRRGARSAGTPGEESPASEHRALGPMLTHVAGLQRTLNEHVARCPGRSASRKRQVFGRLQRAHLFLEGNCHRIVRLTELAELTSFSSWYLSKTFHNLYDESPQAASARLRLERACELLADTDWSISEIGASCGFDNNCSFSRAFRMRFAMTASDFRVRTRDGEPAQAQRYG